MVWWHTTNYRIWYIYMYKMNKYVCRIFLTKKKRNIKTSLFFKREYTYKWKWHMLCLLHSHDETIFFYMYMRTLVYYTNEHKAQKYVYILSLLLFRLCCDVYRIYDGSSHTHTHTIINNVALCDERHLGKCVGTVPWTRAHKRTPQITLLKGCF